MEGRVVVENGDIRGSMPEELRLIFELASATFSQDFNLVPRQLLL